MATQTVTPHVEANLKQLVSKKIYLGERHVPADAYYGIHTLRAIENFNISKYDHF